MNNFTIVLCTPDMHRPTSLRAITKLKQTDLAGVELIIADNAYDRTFHHPSIMQHYLDYAEGAPVIFVDDDVLIEDPAWILKLTATAEHTGAAIVGCMHTYPSGEVNHRGVLVYKDSSTELLRGLPEDVAVTGFVPAVSSALMLVVDSSAVAFDTGYGKYQHDVDICISAWEAGHKVALAKDLLVVHLLADYTSSIAGWHDMYDEDTKRLEEKWVNFAGGGLYERPELAGFASLSRGVNWERIYNRASTTAVQDPGEGAKLFRDLVADCPFDWRKAGAYFHLYRLDGRPEDLKRCVHLNPFHTEARKMFTELIEQGG